jgi:hypothetical protein
MIIIIVATEIIFIFEYTKVSCVSLLSALNIVFSVIFFFFLYATDC